MPAARRWRATVKLAESANDKSHGATIVTFRLCQPPHHQSFLRARIPSLPAWHTCVCVQVAVRIRQHVYPSFLFNARDAAHNCNASALHLRLPRTQQRRLVCHISVAASPPCLFNPPTSCCLARKTKQLFNTVYTPTNPSAPAPPALHACMLDHCNLSVFPYRIIAFTTAVHFGTAPSCLQSAVCALIANIFALHNRHPISLPPPFLASSFSHIQSVECIKVK